MNPQVGRVAFTMAAFIAVMGLLLLPFLERNSAEFVVTVLSIVVGGIMIALIAILARLGRR